MAALDKKILSGMAYAIIVVYFGGLAWGEIAYRYFRHKCATQAGEFIYKTVENVAGIYQMRLRDPKDYFDRMRNGDIPEDPFGHTNVESQEPWLLFLSGNDSSATYRYLESTKPPSERLQRFESFRFENDPEHTGEKYWIYRRAHEYRKDASHNNITAKQTSTIRSRYGFTWREIRGRWDRMFGVWGGELIVKDLDTSAELAVRRGFILRATLSDRAGICPGSKTDMTTGYFLKKVLKPSAMTR